MKQAGCYHGESISSNVQFFSGVFISLMLQRSSIWFARVSL
jgi:hypothetical protein